MLSRPAVRTSRRFSRHGWRERGAGLPEYLGLVLIVAVALSTSASFAGGLLQGGLVKHVEYGVCQAYSKAVGKIGIDAASKCEGLNPEKSQSKLPPCITYQQNRLLSGNIDFRFIRGELTGKDDIIDLVDPVTGDESALVILGNESGAGLEGSTKAGAFFDKTGLSAQGNIVLQGGYGSVYEFDSHKDAQEFLDSHRGNLFKRILGTVPGASAVEGLYQGAKDFVGGLFGGGDDDDDGSDPPPSGVVANLGIQADGSVDFQGNSLPGIKGNVAGLQGKVRASGKESGQIRYNFDGTSQLTVRYEGEVGAAGGVGVSRSLAQKFPWLDNLGITAGGNFNGAVQYRIKFDENFQPTQFELRTEHGAAVDKRVGSDGANLGDSDGSLTVNTYTLDLSDPENLDAVTDTLPWIAASNLAGPAAPVGILLSDNPLSRRLKENSLEYEQVYDTEGDALAANTPDSSREKGLKVGGFGVGANDETAKRTLVSARAIDHSQPGATWQTLEKCE